MPEKTVSIASIDSRAPTECQLARAPSGRVCLRHRPYVNGPRPERVERQRRELNETRAHGLRARPGRLLRRGGAGPERTAAASAAAGAVRAAAAGAVRAAAVGCAAAAAAGV